MSCNDDCTRPTPTQAHCGLCHVTFGGVESFDRHRAGGVCRRPESIGLHVDSRGIWRRPTGHHFQNQVRVWREGAEI